MGQGTLLRECGLPIADCWLCAPRRNCPSPPTPSPRTITGARGYAEASRVNRASMRAVIGVDPTGYWKHAVDVFTRLRLPEADVRLVSVIESMLPDGSFPEVGPNHPLADVYRTLEKDARECLTEAKAALSDVHSIEERIDKGKVVHELLEESEA